MKFPINFYSRERIRNLQFKKLKRVVEYAYQHSMFYRSLYDTNGFKPSDLREYADIQRIPVVRRRDLRNAPVEQLVTCSNLKRCHLHTTSGSSGVSVRFYYSAWEQILKNYYVLRSYLMAGLPWRATTVALRDPIDIAKPNLLQRLGFFRYDYYDIYTPIEEIYNRIKEKHQGGIDVLKGYPSDLVNLANMVEKNQGDFPKVTCIYSDSEVLDAASRAYIERVFGCNILDFYASVECGMIAFQVPNDSRYCINEDAVLLETIEQEGLSEVVISNLRNKTFPIIRYEIGDAIEFGDREIHESMGFMTLRQIYGKYLDFILLPDNTIISPHVPKQEFTHTPGVAKFKLVQTQRDEVEVFIQKNDLWTDAEEQVLREKLDAAFNHQIRIRFIYVEKLDRGDKRKFKCIESLVAQSYLSNNKTTV